jgi:hypothetical protein
MTRGTMWMPSRETIRLSAPGPITPRHHEEDQQREAVAVVGTEHRVPDQPHRVDRRDHESQQGIRVRREGVREGADTQHEPEAQPAENQDPVRKTSAKGPPTTRPIASPQKLALTRLPIDCE